MKKSIKIATLGVAALGVAALPMAGVFAADGVNIYEDELKLTVGQTCSFVRLQGNEHDNEEGWGTAGITDTFAKSVEAGSEDSNIAHSNFKVTCNSAETPFVVTVRTENSANWNYNIGGLASEGSSWTIASNGFGADLTSNAVIKKIDTSSTLKEYEFKITYGAKFESTAEAGLYEALAEYTFAQQAFES